jgi:hypothetical protein
MLKVFNSDDRTQTPENERGKKLENERKEERKKFRLQRQGSDDPSSDTMLETK